MFKTHKQQIILLIVSFLIMLVLIGGTLFLWTMETQDMEQQEQLGEQLADEYLISLLETSIQNTEPIIEDSDNVFDDLEYDDNELFGHHKESEALGTLDCVLEIPAIELRQSVFTGTPSQIRYNLSKWLSVTCRSDYILGSTQYCIYMHNPTNKSIKISYAQDTLVPGDYITLTKDNTVFFYEMTRMFPEWRDVCTINYADNMSLDSTKMYIFTCARGEWQGRNLVIEGTLYDTYELSDWQQNAEQYIAEYKGQYKAPEIQTTESLNLSITNTENVLNVSVTRPDDCQALHCSVGLFDADGYLIGDDYPYEGYPLDFELQPGTYIFGVYDNKTEYLSPMPYQVTLEHNAVSSIQTIDEHEEEIESEGQVMKYVALALTSVFCVMYVIVTVRTIKDIKAKDA